MTKGCFMSIRCFVLISLITLFFCPALPAADNPYIQAKIYFDTKIEWAQLRAMHLDQVSAGDGYVEIVTNRTELDELEALGFKTEIVHPDLAAFFRSRLADKTMGDYKTLSEINDYLDLIIAANPYIVSPKISIGQTYEGRDIWAVKISDNPNLDEDEPEVLFTACIHAREVITPEILFNFMDHLTQNYGIDPDITDLINNRELWFIVMVNPDGYYHNEIADPNGGGMWRKNRRDNGDGSYGVDLNRNFGYAWGYDDEGSSPYGFDETYRGTAAFSEPETQVLRDFMESHEFVISVFYHSYSNLIIWPWGYDRLSTPDDDIFWAMGDSVASMNGYTPEPGWALYPVNGGSDDWSYGEQTTKNKTFSVTVEVGTVYDNFWPPTARIDPLIAENLEPCMFFARVAGDIYRLKPPATPEIFVDSEVNAQNYTVSWAHYDTLNPATTFALLEMTDYQAVGDAADNFDLWENQEFSLSPDRYVSGPYSFYSGSGDNLSRAIRSIDPYWVQPGDSLRFQTYYEIETDWDYAYVEISTDGVNFDPIPGTITTDENPYGSNYGNGITGMSAGWVAAAFDLSEYAGQYVYFRISYHTDDFVTEEGIYVDDISPVGSFGTRSTFSPVADTFYNFTGHPSGDFYYMVRARDVDDQWSHYSGIVKTTAVANYVCGDADGDATVNISDAVFLINYIFKSGPAADPAEAGDANGDGAVNVADAVYLIEYIFKGGPLPVCP